VLLFATHCVNGGKGGKFASGFRVVGSAVPQCLGKRGVGVGE